MLNNEQYSCSGALITIVIPIFNAHKTLERCLTSIVGQTYKNLEIILIDDGSTDCSAIICKEWSEKDSRIVYLYQENSGVSSARNLGIQRSSGDYIAFVDADDYISEDAIHLLYQMAIKDMSDVVFGEYAIVDVDSKKTHYRNELDINSHDIKIELINKLLRVDSKLMMGTACRCLIRTKFLKCKGIQFDTNLRMSEDLKFILTTIHNSTIISIINKTIYYYTRHRNGSATQRYMKTMYQDMQAVDNWKEMLFKNLCKESGDFLRVARANVFIVGVININRPGTPLTLSERARWTRSEYANNREYVEFAIKSRQLIGFNAWVGCVLCHYKLESLYIILRALRHQTILTRKNKVDLITDI